MRQLVLDTETTGLNPNDGHRIIEIGCIELVDRRLTGNNYHQYINPDREIDAGAQKVHGIGNEFLADKPRFGEIAEDLLEYLKGAELIIHNAPFDMGFLNHEYRLWNAKAKPLAAYCKVFDTLPYAREKHPGQRNSLDALCKRYEVDNSGRDLHGALLDAELLAFVYLYMTGGQNKLFQEETAKARANKHGRRVLDTSREPYCVITPSEAELSAHQAYLDELKQDSW